MLCKTKYFSASAILSLTCVGLSSVINLLVPSRFTFISGARSSHERARVPLQCHSALLLRLETLRPCAGLLDAELALACDSVSEHRLQRSASSR